MREHPSTEALDDMDTALFLACAPTKFTYAARTEMGTSAGRRRRAYGRKQARGRGLRLHSYVDSSGARERERASTQLDYTWAALRRLTSEVRVIDLEGRRFEHELAYEGPLEARMVEHLSSFYIPMQGAARGQVLLWDRVFAGGDLEAEFSALQLNLELDPDLVAALLLFRPFWQRSPAGWTGTASALLEHLFALYPIPRFLLNVTRRDPRSIVSRWLPWLIIAGQGGSLRRLSKLARARGCAGQWPQLPKRFTAQLAEVPSELPVRLGVMFAELLRLGGSALEFRRLTSDESYAIDPLVAQPEAREFWTGCARWLIRQRERLEQLEIDDAGVARILAWARHESCERRRRERGSFSWAGRSPAAALHEAEAYARALEMRREQATREITRWRARGWDWWAEVDGLAWTIRELTSSDALAREGQRLKHCVGGYAQLCARGGSAVFSVERERSPCLTVELQLPSGRIVQACGLRNRSPTPAERRLLERWQREVLGQRC